MTALTFRHADGEYPLHIEPGIMERLGDIVSALAPGHRQVVIRDDNLATLQKPPLGNAEMLTFRAGEQHKARATWSQLTDDMLARGADRATVIIAFGGGVTTDLAGFVAATFLRGIPWIAVPTTTLAICDAAIGGKTGVDTAAGKNLVGAFHQPLAVVADPRVLRTLPQTAYIDGLAETVKHAAIADASFWDWLEEHCQQIVARDEEIVTEMLSRSMAIKVEIASSDEREAGRRVILNAGHTVAHGIEHASSHAISHGSAVAIGLVAEARIGERLDITEVGTAERITTLLDRLGLPTLFPERLNRDAYLSAVRHDKKNRAGQLRLALLSRIGAVAGTEHGDWTTPMALDADLGGD